MRLIVSEFCSVLHRRFDSDAYFDALITRPFVRVRSCLGI